MLKDVVNRVKAELDIERKNRYFVVFYQILFIFSIFILLGRKLRITCFL